MSILDRLFGRADPPPQANTALYRYLASGAMERIKPGSAAAQWAGRATRASFEQNLRDSLRGDYTTVDDDLLSRAYIQSITAAACIDKNAQLTSSLPLMVLQKGTDATLEDHPLIGMTDNADELLWWISVSQDIWGRAFLLKRINRNGTLSGLEVIRPPDVELITQTTRGGREVIVGYWIYGTEQVAPGMVIDLPLFDPFEPTGAMSPLERAIIQVSTSRNMATFVANFFFNGTNLSGILKVPEASEAEDVRKIAREFNANFRGARKAWKTHVTNDREADFTPTAPPPKDLAMDALFTQNEAAIARAFQVNPVLIGLTQAGDALSAQNTYDAIEQDQMRSTIIPRLERNLASINRQWSWRDFDPPRHYTLAVDVNAAINAVTADNVTVSSTLWTSGGVTLNEYRERLGFSNLGINGDVVLVGTVPYPAARLAEVANANADAAGQEPAPAFSPFGMSAPELEPPPELSAPDEPPQLPARAIGAQLKELANWERKIARSTPDEAFYLEALAGHPAALWLRSALDARQPVDTSFWIARAWIETGNAPPELPNFTQAPSVRQTDGAALPAATKEEIDRYWRRFDELQADLGAAWLAWMARMWEANRARILANPEDLPDLLTADDQLIADWIGTAKDPGPLAALVLAGMAAGQEAIGDQKSADYRSATRQLQAGVSFDLLSQEALDFVRAYAFDLIKNINGTTVEELQDLIAGWLQSGGDINELADLIQPLFENKHRAKLIARTESLRAYNVGTFNRYKAAGVTEAEWMTVRDNLVCKICQTLHGKAAKLSEGWVLNGKTYFPPAHPNCRCFTRPVIF